MTSKRNIFAGIAILVLLILAAVLYFNRTTLNYYLYVNKAKQLPAYAEHKDELYSAYKNIGKKGTAFEYAELARIQLHLEDYENAEKNLFKAIELDPTSLDAVQNLVYLYVKTENLVKAEALAKLEIAKFPTSPDAYRDLSALYTVQFPDKKSEMVNLYEQAILQTGNQDFVVMLAKYYADTKDYTNAVHTLDRWLAVKNNTDGREDIRDLRREYQIKRYAR